MNIEKVSKYTLTTLMVVSIAIFILFFAVGYDTPWEENPKMNNPQFTDVLCIWTYFLVAVAAVSMFGSFIMYIKEHGLDKSIMYVWGLPILSIGIGVAIGLSNQNEVLLINGERFQNPTDIILTDASMISIIVLSIIAIAVTIWSMVAEVMAKK